VGLGHMQGTETEHRDVREDDVSWPKKNIVGRQELEVRIEKEHISFEVGVHHDTTLLALTSRIDCKNRFIGRCER
jgi:hypothetical protein